MQITGRLITSPQSNRPACSKSYILSCSPSSSDPAILEVWPALAYVLRVPADREIDTDQGICVCFLSCPVTIHTPVRFRLFSYVRASISSRPPIGLYLLF